MCTQSASVIPLSGRQCESPAAGKTAAILHPVEALFFHGGKRLAVGDNRCEAFQVIRITPRNSSSVSAERRMGPAMTPRWSPATFHSARTGTRPGPGSFARLGMNPFHYTVRTHQHGGDSPNLRQDQRNFFQSRATEALAGPCFPRDSVNGVSSSTLSMWQNIFEDSHQQSFLARPCSAARHRNARTNSPAAIQRDNAHFERAPRSALTESLSRRSVLAIVNCGKLSQDVFHSDLARASSLHRVSLEPSQPGTVKRYPYDATVLGRNRLG